MAYATLGGFVEVAPIKMTAKTQCRRSAAAGLSSGNSFRSLGKSQLANFAYGVTVLFAKNDEKGRTPSLATSCLTI